MNNYHNYLFDLDGTLCHTAPDILKVRDAALAEHGLKLELPDDHTFIGPPLGEIMRRFIPSEYSDEFVAEVVLSFRRLYLESPLEQSLPFDGVIDTLDKLRIMGKRLFVVTNKAIEPTRRLLKLCALADYFVDVFSPNVLPGLSMKKHESIAELMKKYQLDKTQTLYVGDTAGDIEAAHKNGIACAFAGFGYGRLHGEQLASPEYRITRFAELLDN